MRHLVAGYDIADMTLVSGVDPFSSDTHATSLGVVIRLNEGARPDLIEVEDGDTWFEDGDGSQDLVSDLEQDGQIADAGERITPEYSYLIRPVDAVDASQDIEIYVYELGLDNDADGLASTAQLEPGKDYRIISVLDNSPSIPYSQLFICFAGGTRIACEGGECGVEDIAVGDLVITADAGPERVVWRGERHLDARALDANPALAPIRIAAGALGGGTPRKDLVVSPQHRILVDSRISRRMTGGEALVAAKHLVGLPGIAAVSVAELPDGVTYHHLMFDAHQIIFAEGARAESLLPGPMALETLCPAARREIAAIFPGLCTRTPPAARTTLPGRRARRLAERHLKNARTLVEV
ncbi:Hint domain-containing protein [Roseicyclus sp. F158]|uniref:Hint domain-containing protein n=1 Tax=Tropicimonas omnivorans TaxID=3075590 RepID=A0ABU3DLH2_9RHOB|nr:Hint domain-containing protein [Roseicyclus sp. F158]MDT0683967.1 Hint domain-containing protein [Roseicyclus sp. F158]